MMRRFLCITFASLAAVVSFAATAEGTALDRPVAVFVASNMKLAVDNALAQLKSTGVECDTARVRQLIIEELQRPYSKAEHDAAVAAIDAAMEAKANAAADMSELMLAQAAAEDGARVMPDGLVIVTLDQGDSSRVKPTSSDKVSIRYTGKLPDGTVFDVIAPDERPMVATVSDLAPGMAEGLEQMHPGARCRLVLPASLAYGKEGVPGVIPPDCALSFDVELLDVFQE